MGKDVVVVGLHYYQPPRNATHPSLSEISTDPEGKDWTKIITQECYRPLADAGVLEKASFDVFQSLLLQLEKLDPKLTRLFHAAMKENGIGEPFIHPILPDLSDEDKDIVILSGVRKFMDITGQHPRYFWPPETAIDTATLERLSYAGYEGFVCAPEQIFQPDGRASDNTPTLIKLPSGRDIVAIPFDRSISSGLGFGPKTNADHFTWDTIVPRSRRLGNNQLLVAWTDAETFGHHAKQADKFLDYLLDHSLPTAGLYPISLKNIPINKHRIPTGRIDERTAWSCPHGNLVRWHGSCHCHQWEDTSWKNPFYDALGKLNYGVTLALRDVLGKNSTQAVVDRFHSVNAHPQMIATPLDALVAAKVSSLTARTSCATFFSSPEVSGKISLLYAYQSLLYLKEAGLEKVADELSATLFQNLSHVRYPHSSRTALTTLEQMLRQG